MLNYQFHAGAIILLFSLLFVVRDNPDKTSGGINASIQEVYQCMPCGSDCDKTTHAEGGKCGVCNMDLVKKSAIQFKSINPEELCAYLKAHPKTVVLDVRTKEEYEGKTDPAYQPIKNAINIPIQVLEQQIGTLDAYKNKEVIVYCSHSRRSPRASYILGQHGFSNVVNMEGGLSVMKDKSCVK